MKTGVKKGRASMADREEGRKEGRKEAGEGGRMEGRGDKSRAASVDLGGWTEGRKG